MTVSDALLIAVPTYNEREKIDTLIDELRRLHPTAHVLVVGLWQLREVPITFVDRRLGQTKMSRWEIYQAAVTLLRIAWQRIAS